MNTNLGGGAQPAPDRPTPPRPPRDAVQIEATSVAAVVTWIQRGARTEFRLDRVQHAHPQWVAAAADLDEIGDRRSVPLVLDAITDWGVSRGETVALFHPDGHLEWLVEPTGADR